MIASHIRWIGHDDVIPLGERLGLFEHAHDFAVRLAKEKLAAEILRLDGAAGEGDGPFVETRLDEGAEVLRLLELVEQLQHRLIEEVAQPEGVDVVAQLVFREAHVAQLDDAGPDEVFRLEEATGLFPGLEDEGQLGELGGAGADFQPVQIMPQDEAGNIARRVAFLLVDEIQKIECVGEHVPAAHGGIEQSNILGLGNAEKIGLRLALDVVGHVLAQPGAWAIEQPEAAEGVLHKVANDPVRSEELGDGGNILGGHGTLASHDGVFFLRDVELVEPAEDFDFIPIRLLAAAYELPDHGVGVQEVIRQQEECGIIQLAEDIGQDAVQLLTLGQEECAVELLIAVARELEADHFVAVQRGERDMLGLLQNLRHAAAQRIAENAVAMVEITVQLHVAKRHETIEPSVGHGLHDLREPLGLDPLQELLAKRHIRAGKWLTTDERHISRLGDLLHAAGLNPQKPGPPGHGLDKRGAGGGSVVFELGGVHLIWMRSFLAMAS